VNSGKYSKLITRFVVTSTDYKEGMISPVFTVIWCFEGEQITSYILSAPSFQWIPSFPRVSPKIPSR